jgi:signal transduction histidine kinase
MRPADLFRRTSFRLALGISVFILTVLILAGTVSYGVMRNQLLARQDARITEIVMTLRKTNQTADGQDLIEAVQARIDASKDRSTVFILRAPDGHVVAANIEDMWVKPGWSVVDAAAFGIATDYPYRVFAGDVGGYHLVVGLTDADLDDLAEIVAAAFGWTAVFAFVAVLASATLIATRVQRRISVVEATLNRVAHGDLNSRLPITARGDDLDQIATAINQSVARLNAQVGAMRQISDDIAHDLRTPLNRLRIRIEDAAARNERGQSVGTDLAVALAECDTISGTFSALLRIAQIEAGARLEKFGPVDLSVVMTDVVEAYTEVAEDAGMSLRHDRSKTAVIQGDQELLVQMLSNLIENAIRHCPPGTAIRSAIAVSAAQQVTMQISDTGPGIPEAEHENVLRRLYRLEKNRTSDGSGLGLALVKAVADLHGANLAFRDAAPGLRVELTFPLPGRPAR